MQDFKHKTVVITGAASGMGRAYAQAFAHLGSRLALCDYDAEGLQETAELISSNCPYAPLLGAFDIAEDQAVSDFAEQVYSELGEVDVLINNAGIEGSTKPVWASDRASFERVMAVNYFGVVNMTRAFLPRMLARQSGVIVNVSSIFGLAGTPNHADYCGSKFAVRGFTEALMAELIESPVQVHLLHPGGIATNIARKPSSKTFSGHFLITPPEDVAACVIDGIRNNTSRIVVGNGAWKANWGARLLPLKSLCALAWKEMKGVIDLSDYGFLKPKQKQHQEP